MHLVREPTPAEPRVEHAFVPDSSWAGKRLFDVIGALCLTIAFSPVIFAIALWLLLTRGPIFYGQTRIGHRGRQFTCYKFRTMVPDADRALHDLLDRRPELLEEWLRDHKLKDDPRVTRIGRLLRKTSLDELPQIWNIFSGEMSLVGPRPIVENETSRYGRTIRHYLATRPGLTGLWQVLGRSETTYRRRVAMDRTYAARCCFGLDIRILLLTVRVVLARAGAY